LSTESRDEEQASEGSPACQPSTDDEDDEPASQPITSEVFFEEDVQKEPSDSLEDGDVDGDLSASMKVSTAELLTPETISKDVEKVPVVEVAEVIEVFADESMGDKRNGEDGTKDNGVSIEVEIEDVRQVDDMDEVEFSVPVTLGNTEVPPTIVKNSIKIDDSGEQPSFVMFSPREVIYSTAIQTQLPLSTAQDESLTTQYPSSTLSNPAKSTQGPSQITATQFGSQSLSQSQVSSSKRSPIIPSAQPAQPSPYFAELHRFSSPKATPSVQISPPKAILSITPASAQVQVKETPLPAQRPAPHQIIFTGSTTHISSTAPSPTKRPAEGPSRRKHKRERHVGPVIPGFNRRERKMKWDLEVMLLEDRRKFLMDMKEVEVASKVQFDKDDTAMEEVIKDSLEAAEPMALEPTNVERDKVEAIESKPDTVEPEFIKPDTVEEVIKPDTVEAEIIEPKIAERESEKPEIVVPKIAKPEAPVDEAKEIVVTQLNKVESTPVQVSVSFIETQDDSQTFNVAQSRWGRFATHWKRFSRST
jgi:hypothetical protein